MLRISRLSDYASAVMTRLAARPSEVLSAMQIAEDARLELPTVSKLLKLLAHAGLVDSFRGANGGYRLSRDAERISLAEIVEAVEGPLGMTECSIGPCERESHCSVRGGWQQVSSAIDGALRAMRLSDMAQNAGPPPHGPPKHEQRKATT